MRPFLRYTVGALLVLAPVAGGQQAPPAPTCDQQVVTTYRGLVEDQVLAELRDATPLTMLGEITAQVRVRTSQYTMERQQSQQYQGQVAIGQERIRQLTDTVKRLQQELETAQRDLAATRPPATAEVQP
jgi:hypothetical protein